jgi:hypothetical protein
MFIKNFFITFVFLLLLNNKFCFAEEIKTSNAVKTTFRGMRRNQKDLKTEQNKNIEGTNKNEIKNAKNDVEKNAETEEVKPEIVVKTYTKVLNKSRLSSLPIKSIMFSQKEINRVLKILASGFKEYVEAEKLAVKDDFENTDSYYLNSIMFVSKDSWTIWINGEKATDKDREVNNLKVLSVSQNRAIFSLDENLDKWKIISENNNIPKGKYRLEENKVVIYFVLNPHQTFLPMRYKVIEGRVKKTAQRIEQTVEGVK